MIISSCNRTHHMCLPPRRQHLSFDSSPRGVAFARRCCLKRRRFAVRSQLDASFFNDLFQSFTSFNFIAPVALGFASAVGLNWRRRFGFGSEEVADVGEWIWFTSPTPFNRFVLLRCPSVLLGQEELTDDVHKQLVEEDLHFVRVNTGRMVVSVGGVERGELKYQRVCVRTEDGGVISIDWPANLKLEEEYGLDTTVLVVPGTVEGSMDDNVIAFVLEALRRGLFPVVMNPRGCAASPLTTPRLFTAADSDDISIAIQFINKARPRTTLIGVGWRYGANMLTKYLAEVGEQTPLMAATCIDNPFDLEELTRSTPYQRALDQKLASGLINILRSNKELFQGREKGFHVDQALSAKSLREFEKAISMVSYGFEDIKDFYSVASTRALVGNVKIPLLFIQSNEGAVPMFSIPRGLIAENPYTSLLICSCSRSKASVSWYQHLTLEWLAAVELGLLKGRHPLLKDVDVTINPPKGLALVEHRAAGKDGRVKKHLDLSQPRIISTRYGGDSKKFMDVEDKEVQVVQNGAFMQTNLVEPKFSKEDDESEETERGHVLQTTQVVMNMLDVYMPGTLREDEKQKVLAAVSRGETVMKALQDALPEDVRGKLTDAVSLIMRAQSINLKEGIGRIPSIGGSKSNILETVENAQNEIKWVEKLDLSDNHQAGNGKLVAGAGSEILPSENADKFDGAAQSQQSTNQQSGASSADRKDANDSVNHYESDAFTKEKALTSDSHETGIAPEFRSQIERAVSSNEVNDIEPVVNRDGEMKEDNTILKKEDKTLDSSDQNKMTSASTAEAAAPSAASSADVQSLDGEQNDNPRKENKYEHTGSEPNKATASNSTPTFSVSEALDALSGIDDSTQVAVNSVFGVIETMINEMEGKDYQDEAKGGDGAKDENVDPGSGRVHTPKEGEDDRTYHTLGEKEVNGADCILGNKQCSKTGSQNMTSGKLYIHEDDMYAKEEKGSGSMIKLSQSHTSTDWNHSDDSDESKVTDGWDMEGKRVNGQLMAKYSDGLINGILSNVNMNPYVDTLPKEYSRQIHVSGLNTEPLDVGTTTALLLDYFPEEGQWKLLEQPASSGDFSHDATTESGIDRESEGHSTAQFNEMDTFIEPSYVILDTEIQQEPFNGYESDDSGYEEDENGDERLGELMKFAKNIILDILQVEVKRKLSKSDLKQMESELSRDLDKVATAVCLAIGHDQRHTCDEGKDSTVDCSSDKVGSVRGESIIRAISSTIPDTSYLRRVLPVGVIVGSSLAAIRKHFHLTAVNYSGQKESKTSYKATYQKKAADKIKNSRKKKTSVARTGQNSKSNSLTVEKKVEGSLKNLDNGTVMVGAVTAALGASAFLAQKEEPLHAKGTSEKSESLKKKGSQHIEDEKVEGEMPEKHGSNLVTSLAEKAMSVAAPVVPTKEDGEVDQERLVAMLTEWGQRGGMLRLLGKIALLWGGIRGAMSLNDKLIMFLHIAERPLLQRMLSFLGMVLVLWSPVVIPLLPAIVQGWTVNNPSRIAELASIVGFYSAVMLLILLWGKRMHGYENPLEEYGLDLASPMKIQSFSWGLVGGFVLVTLIQSVNAILGGACFHWPLGPLSSSTNIMTSFKSYWELFVLAIQAILTATGAVVVEELLFRSWLPEEIAADLGYHRGIILSGLVFSFFQRSLWAIPGLWAMSLALAGLRQRNGGSLAIPIGLRAGIMASSFILQRGGFLTYRPSTYYRWLMGTNPLQPLSGIVGLAFSIILAVVLYPKEPLRKERPKKTNQK